MMIPAFITIRFLDILDIILVAVLMYQLYQLIRGTTAFYIFVAIVAFYFAWRLVVSLNMQLLGLIMGQVMGVGLIAIMIVFQQEIRRFLLYISTRYMKVDRFSIERLVKQGSKDMQANKLNIEKIISACSNLSKTRIGALIAISNKSDLQLYYKRSEVLDAKLSTGLLESIFFTNNPLHDGGVIIMGNRILAARCVFPVSENPNLPPYFGLRHRAALGLTEETDALVIVVSEETGRIAYAKSGLIKTKVQEDELRQYLERDLD